MKSYFGCWILYIMFQVIARMVEVFFGEECNKGRTSHYESAFIRDSSLCSKNAKLHILAL